MGNHNELSKSRTGIQGLDDLTGGGLPKGRPTLVCGAAGCGKTLLAIEFLIHGALRYGEPGVFIAFEESAQDLTCNVASLGFNLDDLVTRRLLAIDFVQVDSGLLEQSGEFDLEGLFIRLGHAIDSIGAKRIVLDTMESLFAGLPNPATLRAEITRLFRWLKDRGITALITGERGSGQLSLTREGLEEYVSDCVILLDHRVTGMVSSRRLRVVKYRGSSHGTNEYPFLIDKSGISLLPVTSLGLQHDASNERIPTGVPALDEMLGGLGYFRGSSILVSGTAGTGKSSLAAHFAVTACKRGERVMYFAFEESASQIVRNMQSIGVHFAEWTKRELLEFHAARPTLTGLEMHLATMLKEIDRFKPEVVIVDPLNSFVTVSNEEDVKSMLLRMVDALKLRKITGFFTSLTSASGSLEATNIDISSLIDTWLLVRAMESGGERNRGLYILKSRGMYHSNQIREFSLTGHGIELRDAYVGPAGVLTGSARLAQEAQERAAQLSIDREIQRRRDEVGRMRAVMEAKIDAIRIEFETQEAAALILIEQAQNIENTLIHDRDDMAQSRSVNVLSVR